MSLPERTHEGDAPKTGPLVDRYGRAHSYLRLSVTDRCNYRCTYCLPMQSINWMRRADLLSYEEIERLLKIFAGMGIRRVRLTGGEPLVRRDLVDLVRRLGAIEGLDDIAITTNGHVLAAKVAELKAAGLSRVNVSLDTLDPEAFREVTRGGTLSKVLEGIEAARREGLTPIKVNCVVVKGINDDAPTAMLDYFAPHAEDTIVRFIEAMPFAGTVAVGRHVASEHLRDALADRLHLVSDGEKGRHGGPATAWRVRDSGLRVGFISAMSEHFCESCNRLRLQADGTLRTCLSREAFPSLRERLRSGASDHEIEQAIREQVWHKVAGHEAHLSGKDHRMFEGVMTSIGG